MRYFFLEVRSSILSDKLYCPPDTCVLLASYACQARHGDYNKLKHSDGFLAKENLVPQRYSNQLDLHLIIYLRKLRVRTLIKINFLG